MEAYLYITFELIIKITTVIKYFSDISTNNIFAISAPKKNLVRMYTNKSKHDNDDNNE